MQRRADHPVRLLLRDLVRRYGSVARVARETGLSRYQVMALVGDAPVHDGTIAFATACLESSLLSTQGG